MEDQKWQLLIDKIDRIQSTIDSGEKKTEKRFVLIEERVTSLEHFKIRLTPLFAVITFVLGLSYEWVKSKFLN